MDANHPYHRLHRHPTTTQASNKDLQNLFGSYGIEWVEWLNGECVNVLFKDAAKAEEAMQDISEPIPIVQGTLLVHTWRVGAAWRQLAGGASATRRRPPPVDANLVLCRASSRWAAQVCSACTPSGATA